MCYGNKVVEDHDNSLRGTIFGLVFVVFFLIFFVIIFYNCYGESATKEITHQIYK